MEQKAERCRVVTSSIVLSKTILKLNSLFIGVFFTCINHIFVLFNMKIMLFHVRTGLVNITQVIRHMIWVTLMKMGNRFNQIATLFLFFIHLIYLTFNACNFYIYQTSSTKFISKTIRTTKLRSLMWSLCLKMPTLLWLLGKVQFGWWKKS